MTLYIKKINDGKKGVFSDRSYEADDIVLKFPGISLTAAEVGKLSKEDQGNVLQIGQDHYLDMRNETAHFLNHHCNSNCYIKAVVNNAFLLALRPIAKGEEITFDYSMTSTDDEKSWEMLCSCHKYYCRKKISGFNSLPDDKKKEMIEKKLVPRYISK